MFFVISQHCPVLSPVKPIKSEGNQEDDVSPNITDAEIAGCFAWPWNIKDHLETQDDFGDTEGKQKKDSLTEGHFILWFNSSFCRHESLFITIYTFYIYISIYMKGTV